MSSLDVNDTIVAIASAAGGGLRGIIRLSGPNTAECLQHVFSEDPPRGTRFCNVNSATMVSGRLSIDSQAYLPGNLLFWPDERSYTRQPTAEFHTIGSAPLLNLAIEQLCQHGARLAEPGEFTLRAFLSGRIDLTQAEAVLAVIDSRGQEQLQTALRQLAGGLTGPLDEIRSQLIGLVAELEAGLDFVEEDIEFITTAELHKQLQQIDDQLRLLNQQIQSRDLEHNEFRVALIGAPNVGKSSLFNSLLGESRAIVADLKGTTRDFVTDKLVCNGVNVQLVDTAGIENVDGQVEPTRDAEKLDSQISIADQAQLKTNQQLDEADLRLVCISADCWQQSMPMMNLRTCRKTDIVVLTKSDLINDLEKLLSEIRLSIEPDVQIIATSCQTGLGIESLTGLIAAASTDLQASRQGIVGSTVARARESLFGAAGSVELALQAVHDDLGLEIVASECRIALDELGRVVGKIYTDDILDQVFGRFCIGK